MSDVRTGRKGRGFTLVELTMVLVIAGSLAAIVLPRITESDRSLMVQAETLARDLRHVQLMAMNQGRALTIDVQSGMTYQVASDGAVVTDPATLQPYRVVLDDDVTVIGADIRMDSLGRPSGAAALLATERVFTLSGKSRTVAVVVSPVTGFVEVTP